MQSGKNYLRVEDVATKLGLSKSTIRKYVFNKQIPHIKLTATLLFDEAEIDKWVQDKKVDVQ